MTAASPPDKLAFVRITSLFPFPVAGRDATPIWSRTPDDLSSLGLCDISREAWDLDVREHFTTGGFDPIVRVYSETSGKRWILVYNDSKETLVQLPLEEADYAPGDRVYSKGNPDLPYYLGTVESLCPKPILAPFQCAMVKWDKDPNGASATPIKDIALINNFTPPRLPLL